MRQVTFVTGYLDLARHEPRPGRTWEIYLERARFLLAQPVPLVVFAEPDRLGELSALRPAGYPTLFCTATVAELVALSDRERMQACIERSPIPWNRDKDTGLYFVTMRQKFEWLRRAMEIDQFRTEHFAWIDLALPRLDGSDSAMKEGLLRAAEAPCPERLRFCSLSYVAEAAFATRHTFYSRHHWPLAGGFFVGPKHSLLWLVEAFGREWDASLDEGLAASDEMMLGFIAHANPERFEFYYGDHPTLLANYVGARHSHPLILAMVVCSRNAGDHQASLLRLEAIRPHLDEREAARWADFWEEWYVANYYLNRRGECRRALAVLVEGALASSDKLSVLRARAERLVSNAAFVQEPARLAFDFASRAPELTAIDALIRDHGLEGRVDVVVDDDFHPLMLSAESIRCVRRSTFRPADYDRVLSPPIPRA